MFGIRGFCEFILSYLCSRAGGKEVGVSDRRSWRERDTEETSK